MEGTTVLTFLSCHCCHHKEEWERGSAVVRWGCENLTVWVELREKRCPWPRWVSGVCVFWIQQSSPQRVSLSIFFAHPQYPYPSHFFSSLTLSDAYSLYCWLPSSDTVRFIRFFILFYFSIWIWTRLTLLDFSVTYHFFLTYPGFSLQFREKWKRTFFLYQRIFYFFAMCTVHVDSMLFAGFPLPSITKVGAPCIRLRSSFFVFADFLFFFLYKESLRLQSHLKKFPRSKNCCPEKTIQASRCFSIAFIA